MDYGFGVGGVLGVVVGVGVGGCFPSVLFYTLSLGGGGCFPFGVSLFPCSLFEFVSLPSLFLDLGFVWGVLGCGGSRGVGGRWRCPSRFCVFPFFPLFENPSLFPLF